MNSAVIRPPSNTNRLVNGAVPTTLMGCTISSGNLFKNRTCSDEGKTIFTCFKRHNIRSQPGTYLLKGIKRVKIEMYFILFLNLS